jgi:hypothetical protein
VKSLWYFKGEVSSIAYSLGESEASTIVRFQRGIGKVEERNQTCMNIEIQYKYLC